MTIPNEPSGSKALGSQERTLVLVCTYNERENLPTLFEGIGRVLPNADLLVVDDGSPDGTSAWVREQQQSKPHVLLIERSGKQGLGTAIRTGMEYAIRNGYSWLINLDGDMSHDPSAIPSLLSQSHTCDVVIGSRYVKGGGLEGCSWRRILVSRVANQLARWMVGWKIRDCSSAYRLYRVSMLQKVELSQLHETGYGFLEEVLAHLLRLGARVAEMPIVYVERRNGVSKISIKEARSAFSAFRRASKILRRRA